MSQPFRFAFIIVVSALLPCAVSDAADIYRWTDGQGRVQYGDRAPPGVRAERIAQEAESVDDAVDLDVQQSGAGWDVMASNRLQGPVEVQLRLARERGIVSTPPMPVSATLAPRERRRVARLALQGNSADFLLDLRSVPGDPLARPRDVAYRLPFDETQRYRIGQSFHGGLTHQDEQNRFAVDFTLPVGTPLLAARAGTVMQTSGDFDRAGTDRKLAQRANFIRILHDDGSMGLYAHLRQNGVMVREGQKVGIGELIGYSGNTGYSSGPHLHFCVQINRNGRLVSIPFRMVGPDGFLSF